MKQHNEPCGILGRKLGHTYSPQIHSILGDYEYRIFEVEPEDTDDFFKHRAFKAINVTMPYKKVALEACDFVSELAQKIGSVNTVVKDEQGKLHGYNTDAPGMAYMLRKAGIDVNGRKCLILGSGGSSVMAQYMLREMGVASLHVISRKGEDNYNNLDRHADAEIIINATPVGMYPDTGTAAIDIKQFRKCIGVADFIYNPSATKLLQDATKEHINCTNGIPMLVAQAKYASDLFLSTQRDDNIIDPIAEMLKRQMRNIIITGHNTYTLKKVGENTASITGRELTDLSEMTDPGENTLNILNDYLKQSKKVILIHSFNNVDEKLRNIIFQNGTLFCLNDNGLECTEFNNNHASIWHSQSELEEIHNITGDTVENAVSQIMKIVS